MAWSRRSTEHPPLRLTGRVGDECTSPRSPRQAACRSSAPRPGSCPDGPARAYLAAPRAALLPPPPCVPPALLVAARSPGGLRGRGSGDRRARLGWRAPRGRAPAGGARSAPPRRRPSPSRLPGSAPGGNDVLLPG